MFKGAGREVFHELSSIEVFSSITFWKLQLEQRLKETTIEATVKDTVGYMRLSGHNAHAIQTMLQGCLTKTQMESVQGLIPEEVDEEDDLEFERQRQPEP